MAAPSFPQPMYAPLRDLSVQYVMPGADLIPAESVGLVLTNPAFIEAYMVGLSHELARQLLFAGYPTDCMGTYFRQFWDVSGYVPQAGRPDRSDGAGRDAAGHPADRHLGSAPAARRAPQPRRGYPTRSY